MTTMTREQYVRFFGPTTGDRVRLGNTSLMVEVEHDHAEPGEELTTGGGKTFRDAMGYSAGHLSADGALDLVIHNALVIDPVLGVVKGDIGVRAGKIVGVGKAGNPATMTGVSPDLICGPSTLVAHGEGMIATPGGIDVHVHHKTPELIDHAIASGLTTMIGGGHGPLFSVDSGGEWTTARMLESAEHSPLNHGFFGRGSSHRPGSIVEHLATGIIGVKIHEDYGAMPATVDNCLQVADEYDFQVQLHTDTLNESGFYEDLMEAIGGRTIHMYHTEGAGGGHAPDIIRCNGEPHCLPSSTNPTNPYTVNTFDEHLDMLMTVHHLSAHIPEDVAFAESRIRAQTIAAEDVLHDMGAISMIGSDSMGMGRIGEVISRCWQLASKMRDQRGRLAEENTADADNERVKRYLAKYTINAARVFGIDACIGSLEPGKMADIVLWKPTHFGIKPSLVIKGGFTVWAMAGDAASSIGASEPVMGRKQWGSFGIAPTSLSTTFVHELALQANVAERLGLKKPLTPIGATRGLTKNDMLHNDVCPAIKVNPQTFDVFVDGELAVCEPLEQVTLGQLYLLR